MCKCHTCCCRWCRGASFTSPLWRLATSTCGASSTPPHHRRRRSTASKFSAPTSHARDTAAQLQPVDCHCRTQNECVFEVLIRGSFGAKLPNCVFVAFQKVTRLGCIAKGVYYILCVVYCALSGERALCVGWRDRWFFGVPLYRRL